MRLKVNKSAILDYIRENNYTYEEFCELCNIEWWQFRLLLRSKRPVEFREILRMSRNMKVNLYMIVETF